MKKDPCSLIISPGYADSGPDHWQSIWLRQFPHSVKVEQKDWLNPSLESWLSALDAAVLSVKNRIILVGHSLGSTPIVHWAQRERVRKIEGALLVALPDPNSEAYRALGIEGFDPLPLNKLPFPSILVASANDPFATLEKSKHFADCLGSKWINIGKQQHIGSDSNVGEWQEGKDLLKNFNFS